MNVESGSKIDVHTVLKLMALAITAMYASSGASSGVATWSTCSDLRGSLSGESSPSNIDCSSRVTNAARYDSGIARAPMSSPDAPFTMASRISCMPAYRTAGYRCGTKGRLYAQPSMAPRDDARARLEAQAAEILGRARAEAHEILRRARA